MSEDQAILLINELVAAEVEVMKQFTSRKNGVTKKAHLRESAAAGRLFYELTERQPSKEQIEQMVSL